MGITHSFIFGNKHGVDLPPNSGDEVFGKLEVVIGSETQNSEE